jgi:hypothetical protein
MTYHIIKVSDGTYEVRTGFGCIEDNFASKAAARKFMNENYDWTEA